MIPSRFTLSDIQSSFADLYRKIEPWVSGNPGLNGRRVTGAGEAIDPADYITKQEVDTAIEKLKSAVKTAKDTGTALDPGIVYAAAALDSYHLIVGAPALNGHSRVTEVAGLGTATQVLHGAAAGPPTFGAVVLTTDVSGILPPVNRVSDTVGLTAQVADISATALTNVTAPGTYQASCALLTTTADAAAGTIALTLSYTDNIGATTETLGPLTLTAQGRAKLTTGLLRVASGGITYAVTHTGAYGTAQYALYIGLERLS